ncbi:DUF2771 domain-containing protein [Mycolicibacterium litorale]|uniref:DUF2771 domain-containing protein n=1 Tax=Mycolicibacterium litorale TaxID=758802 RepID=A0AAD1MX90_9MYCO|nr:DUF2771 domain-containing protein [Mycolicibacterium litorale]MCV7418309.1 DUF2771 domain-containing protein [Mycolicibacterium litorale]TDY06296.1 uncharacterized protein DUF2771 [Mycolicibacterium litorale]BBY19558.1 hypothetical protein MLIT_51500 [Mycolicibacterium litorale]
MKRVLAVLAAVAVLATAATAFMVWQLSRDHEPMLPEISAYSRGELTRVGPYQYCNVVDLNDCAPAGSQGELQVDERDPVQLSVPSAIAEAPWRLLQVYEDPANTTESLFRPDTRLAVTIPTVDPQRGRLTGIAVQLMTLVQDETGEVFEVPHAEWSIRTVWP